MGFGALNEGRGAYPGDTFGRFFELAIATISLNEGRGAYPGDTSPRHRHRRAPSPLNEGRGAYPGDTRDRGESHCFAGNAQRRPGCLPRRHERPSVLNVELAHRSTKAGVLTPATRPRIDRADDATESAQRRPGCLPRRHTSTLAIHSPLKRRSTKAGVLTPATRAVAGHMVRIGGRTAQRRPGCLPRRHAYTTLRSRSTRGPLNEGRGAYPGDTRSGPTRRP